MQKLILLLPTCQSGKALKKSLILIKVNVPFFILTEALWELQHAAVLDVFLAFSFFPKNRIKPLFNLINYNYLSSFTGLI